MEPETQLAWILRQIPWDVTRSPRDNIQALFMEPETYQERIQILSRPIPGLRRLKIYYPIYDEYLQPVDYSVQRDISPLEVLNSISEFYDQPLSRDHLNRLLYEVEGDRIAQVVQHNAFMNEETGRVESRVFLNGLFPYRDGYALVLRS